MDLLPHAGPLGTDEKIRVQGRMLALKTTLDHAAGDTHDLSPEGVALQVVARRVLDRIDRLPWNSEPDRKWYAVLYEARSDVEKFVQKAKQ